VEIKPMDLGKGEEQPTESTTKGINRQVSELLLSKRIRPRGRNKSKMMRQPKELPGKTHGGTGRRAVMDLLEEVYNNIILAQDRMVARGMKEEERLATLGGHYLVVRCRQKRHGACGY
jgi:hypothetical protein